MQNVIIKGKDNPVEFKFTFSGDFETNGLNNFTRITVTLGNETYATDDATIKLFVDSPTELRLTCGDVTALDAGYYTPIIVGYNAIYDDGYELNGRNKRKVDDVLVA